MTKASRTKVWDGIGLVLLAGIIFFSVKNFSSKLDKASDYMVVNGVTIANGYSWEDLPVIYDRTILEEFDATWTVEIFEVGNPEIACTGTDYSHYNPEDNISAVTLSWYVGVTCELDPGASYVARTEWNLDNGISIRNTSNVFTIYYGTRDKMEGFNDNF